MIPQFLGSQPTDNRILAALDKSANQSFFSQLQRVSLPQGEIIYEADDPIHYVYFPESAVFSMLASMEDGRTVEVGPVGKEGLVGLQITLGALTTRDRVLVHIAGDALRVKPSLLKAELVGAPTALSDNITRYTGMLLGMTARTCACNKLHSLEQQFARWLLTMSDYVGKELRLTHELMGLTLGVRRAGVTVAASSLRTRGLIDYQRTVIQIVDREGLKAVACECYPIIKEMYDDLYADLSMKREALWHLK